MIFAVSSVVYRTDGSELRDDLIHILADELGIAVIPLAHSRDYLFLSDIFFEEFKDSPYRRIAPHNAVEIGPGYRYDQSRIIHIVS